MVTAVDAAGLVDTLNGEGPFTIFAPANSAFAAVPAADLEGLLADPTGALTDNLTLHVVAGQQLSSADLAEIGTIDSIGGTLTFAADGDALTVDGGGGPATVVCRHSYRECHGAHHRRRPPPRRLTTTSQ